MSIVAWPVHEAKKWYQTSGAASVVEQVVEPSVPAPHVSPGKPRTYTSATVPFESNPMLVETLRKPTNRPSGLTNEVGNACTAL